MSVPIIGWHYTTLGNEVLESPDGQFYVSYDDGDGFGHGGETTALVYTPGGSVYTQYFILKGDWRNQYGQIINKGWAYCYSFFKRNRARMRVQ